MASVARMLGPNHILAGRMETNGSRPNYRRETDSINEPIVSPNDVEPVGAVKLSDYLSEHNRKAYLLKHAPEILAALITRRASSDPDHLVELAVNTANQLYEFINPRNE
jgi:hypothetical protein